jgi:hypothetical protein
MSDGDRGEGGAGGDAAVGGVGEEANQWDGYADRLRARLPMAPEPLLDAYVQWGPWVVIVLGALGLLGLLGLLGMGGMSSYYGGYYGSPYGMYGGGGSSITTLLGIVSGGLGVAGGIQMRRMRKMGWWLVAAGGIVGALSSLLSASLLGLLVLVAIAYVHLLVKPRYH